MANDFTAFGRSVRIVIGTPFRRDTTVYSGEISSPDFLSDYALSQALIGNTGSTSSRRSNYVEDSTTTPSEGITYSNLESDGFEKHLFDFSFESTRGSATNGSSREKSFLTLYDLNDDDIEFISKPNRKVMIYLGYHQKVDLYYVGDIEDVSILSEGVDKAIKMTLKDGGHDTKSTFVGLEYGGVISVGDVLKDLGSKFPTGTVGIMSLDYLKEKKITGGITVQGNLSTQFEQLCTRFKVQWYRWNGKIILQPLQLVNGSPDYNYLAKVYGGYNTYEIKPDNVISLSPVSQNKNKATTDKNIKRAIQLTTFMAPMELGQFIEITKETDKKLAGTYKITTIKIEASKSGNFDITVRGEPM